MNLREAEDSIKRGVYAGLIFGALVAAISLIAMSQDDKGSLSYWDDPWMFAEVALILVITFGVSRKSRAAAIALFLYYLVSRVALMVELNTVPGVGGILFTIIFLFVFGKAIFGSFAYHRIRKIEDPEYKAVKLWMKIAAVPAVLVAALSLFLLVLGILGPPTVVVHGGELSIADQELLLAEDIVESDERIVYFYSPGLFSLLEGGSVMTDKRMIAYGESEGERYHLSASFGEIENAEWYVRGGDFSDSVISITDSEGDVINLTVSAEAGGDQLFMDELQTRISESKFLFKENRL